jgi:alpha-glucosidase
MAMSVVYEAGLKIYAEHGHKLLEWPGREMIKDVPAEWDETKFIAGWPGRYIVVARRKERDWYVAGMTDEARTVELNLNFLTEGIDYNGLLFKDRTHDTMTRETPDLENSAKLSIDLLDRGGFTLRLRSNQPN